MGSIFKMLCCDAGVHQFAGALASLILRLLPGARASYAPIGHPAEMQRRFRFRVDMEAKCYADGSQFKAGVQYVSQVAWRRERLKTRLNELHRRRRGGMLNEGFGSPCPGTAGHEGLFTIAGVVAA